MGESHEKDINKGLELYRATEGALLIDLRDNEDYLKSHVPGAINIPFHNLREEIRTVATFRTPVFLYCYNGRRSAEAAAMLASRGYEEARDIGGIMFYSGETTDPTVTIKELREQLNIRQADFAKSIGMSTVTISAYETGRQKISRASAEKIRSVYHVQVVDAPPEEENLQPVTPVVKAPGAGRKKKKFTSVRELREAYKMSQGALGTLLGISGTAVGHYETGRSNPSKKILERIQALFGVELLIGEPEGKAASGKEGRKKAAQAVSSETVSAEASSTGKSSAEAAPAKRGSRREKPATPRVVLQDGNKAIPLEELLTRFEGAEEVRIRWKEGKGTWIRGDESGEFDLNG